MGILRNVWKFGEIDGKDKSEGAFLRHRRLIDKKELKGIRRMSRDLCFLPQELVHIFFMNSNITKCNALIHDSMCRLATHLT